MENSSSFSRLFRDFLGEDLRSSQVSTELQLKCSGESSSSGSQRDPQSSTSYFQVTTKPGPNSLTEVTVTEVRKTQFLTSSSTLDRLLSQNQGFSLFRSGGSDLGFRLLSPQQDSVTIRREEGQGSRNLPVIRLQDSPRGGESQNSLPNVLPKKEAVELNLAKDLLSAPPGFQRKYGPNAASEIPKDFFPLPNMKSPVSVGEETQKKFHGPKNEAVELNWEDLLSAPPGFHKMCGPNAASVIPNKVSLSPHLKSPISPGRETQKQFHLKTEPNNKDEFNSATHIPPPQGFSSKNGLAGASWKNVDLTEEHEERHRAGGRIRSLPHPKYGPYKCPQCLEVYPTSQHYAAHVAGHHRCETLGEKKRRHELKFKNRKFKMIKCPDGLTIVQDQSSNSIDDEVEVVFRNQTQNGVVLDRQMRSHAGEKEADCVQIRTGISQAGKGHLHVRELKTSDEILQALQGPFACDDHGKKRSPESWMEEVRGGSSSNYNEKNHHWTELFANYLKKQKPC